MTTIAIVGAGLIGRAWATVFARTGATVALYDPVPSQAEAAQAFVTSCLSEDVTLGLIDPDIAQNTNIRIARSIADAVKGADLVQENGPETLEAKRTLYAEMDGAAAPDTILASSTSFIPCSAFSEGLPGQARCIVAHPVNPPHLVPIVELAPAPWTSPATVARAKAIYEAAHQVPILLRKEVPGFVLNRLQAALLAEAFRIVGAGICSPDDVDKTIRDGLGHRWSFMGPFETIELNAPGGIPDYAARYSASLERMVRNEVHADPFSPATVETIMSQWPGAQTPERIAELAKWRDERLMAFKVHKRQAKPKPVS